MCDGYDDKDDGGGKGDNNDHVTIPTKMVKLLIVVSIMMIKL